MPAESAQMLFGQHVASDTRLSYGSRHCCLPAHQHAHCHCVNAHVLLVTCGRDLEATLLRQLAKQLVNLVRTQDRGMHAIDRKVIFLNNEIHDMQKKTICDRGLMTEFALHLM